MKRVLALDLSSAVGWAADPCGDAPPGLIPDRGVWRLPGFQPEVSAQSFGKLFRLVQSAIRTRGIELVAYEEVLPGSAEAKAFWLQKAQMGQIGAVEAAAEDLGCAVTHAAVASIRKHFCGSGRPRDKKQAVIRACLQRGWTVGDHNAADACALWSYAKSILVPEAAAGLTPLFSQREAAEA